MKKIITVIASILSLTAYSQREFKLISPTPVTDLVYFKQNDTVEFVMEASGFDSNYTFNITVNTIIEASFKFSDFKNGKLTKKVVLKGYTIPVDSPAKCMVYNQYFWVIKTNVTDIVDSILEESKEYVYYDINGVVTDPNGLVFRSDGKKIIFK